MFVPWEDKATADLFEEFDDRIVGESSRTPPEHKALLTRTAAVAGQLALIVAVGVNPGEPVVTREIQEWANAVAEHSLRSMMRGAEINISDNDRQAEYKRVLAMIGRAGKLGVLRNRIAQNLKGVMDRRRMHDVIEQLIEAREVVEQVVKPASGGRTSSRLWIKAKAPKEAER